MTEHSVEQRLDDLEDDDKTFSAIQLAQLRMLMSEALGNVGLRIDDPSQIDEARKDFTFVRNLRKGINGTASKIGWAVITAIVGALFWIAKLGLDAWKVH